METQRKIDNRQGAPYRDRTLMRLDRALQWKPGTCQSILDGKAGDDPSEWVDVQGPGKVGDQSL